MTLDLYELARAEEMLTGYSARWYDEPLEWLAVEAEFATDLVNPETGAPSRTFQLGGKLDGVVRHRPTGRVLVVERKTSSEDLTAGSTYWKRLLLNPQVSNYLPGARGLGFDPTGVLYDVLGKLGIRPSQVPIIEEGAKVVLDANGARVRTKDGKKWRETGDSAAGYVLQTRPETVDEHRARAREAICAEPDRYFVRGDVVRLADEEREAGFDAWMTAASIREARRLDRHPRNPDACLKYGSICNFFGVCTGETSIDDPTRFRRVDNIHEELTASKRKLPLLTTSEMGAYRACARLHHYRYDRGLRALEDTENQRFGTLIHTGLEAWSRAVMAGALEDECVGQAIEAMRTPPKKPELAKTLPHQPIREGIVL